MNLTKLAIVVCQTVKIDEKKFCCGRNLTNPPPLHQNAQHVHVWKLFALLFKPFLYKTNLAIFYNL